MEKVIFKRNEVVTFMIGGVFSADAGWKHKTRYHRGDYELIICTKGPINLLVGNESLTLNKNDIAFIPPFTLMKGTVTSTKLIEFYWLHFILHEKQNAHLTAGENEGQDAPIKKQHPAEDVILPTEHHFRDMDVLLILTHQLLTVDASFPFSQEQQNLLMTLILIQIANATSDNAFEDKNSTVIKQLKEWIRTNIFRSPTLADIAKEAELNPQYISRLFKRYVGMSPKHYMIQLKVQTAQALLIRTNLSVKEISSYAYFSDEKLFMKQFKNISGVTPSVFRNEYRKIYHNNQIIDPVLPIPEEITQKLDNDIDPGTPKR